MRGPGHDDFRTVCLLILFDRDQVGKTLQRVAGSRLHAEHRPAGMPDELVQDLFVVIVFLAFETGKGTYADHVAIATHHRNRF